jgi:hypothetical protein
MEDAGRFYSHFGLFYGHEVYFMGNWYILDHLVIFSQVWYAEQRKIWQPCSYSILREVFIMPLITFTKHNNVDYVEVVYFDTHSYQSFVIDMNLMNAFDEGTYVPRYTCVHI